MNLFVANLPQSADDAALKECFEQYGAVASAQIITDHQTGRSRGFGFVLMKDDREALLAIQELNGRDWDGRRIQVNVAHERARPPVSVQGFRRLVRRWRSAQNRSRLRPPARSR